MYNFYDFSMIENQDLDRTPQIEDLEIELSKFEKKFQKCEDENAILQELITSLSNKLAKIKS